MKVMEFLAVNAFLLFIVLVGAGCLFVFGSIAQALDLHGDAGRIVWIMAGLASIFAAYYISKFIYHRIARR